MHRHLLIALAAVVMLTSISSAQIFEMGPGGGVRVNTPFVRVEVGPTGETFVRAPFASVHAPGRPFVEPPFIEPPFMRRRMLRPMFQVAPQVIEAPIEQPRLAELDWRELRAYVQRSAHRLNAELDRRANADVWRNYLRTQRVIELTAAADGQPPGPNEVEECRAILEVFDATIANPGLRRVTGLSGFQAVHSGLRELSSGSRDGLRERLAASAVALDRELRRVGAAVALRRYLELPIAVYAGSESVDPSNPAAENLEELQIALERYDRVSDSPDHRVVAELESFRNTHRWLTEYVLGPPETAPQEPEPATPESEPFQLRPEPAPQPLEAAPELLPAPEPIPNQ